METAGFPKSFEAALDHLDTGLLVLTGRTPTFVNEAMQRILGYSLEELKQLDPLSLLDESARSRGAQRWAETMTTGRPPQRVVYPIVRKDGERRQLEVSAAVLDGTEIIVLARDVTEQLAAAERARQKHKMEAIGQLAAGIAHDFNNYLTVVRLLAESMRAGTGNPEADLEELEQLTENAASLTAQLMTFGAGDPRPPTVVEINVTVFEMLAMLERLTGEDVELTTHLEPGLPPVEIDQGQLQQIIVNLVVNAGWAVRERGGRVTVETQSRDGEPDRVYLIVHDDGVGMGPEVRERALEPLYSTHPQTGSGMGLAIVYGIVTQCGGELSIESELQKGTTIEVALPIALDPFGHRDSPEPSSDAPANRDTILVVEDAAAIRERLVPALEARGYQASGVANGNVALERIEQEPFDVLVTDVRLPGADGAAVAAAFRQANPNAAIVFISGYPESFDATTLGGQHTFLKKPFSFSELIETIEAMLD